MHLAQATTASSPLSGHKENLAMQRIPRLVFVFPHHTNLGDVTGYLIGIALPQCAVQALDLSHNMIGNDGANCLAEAIRRDCYLSSLNLSYNKVGLLGLLEDDASLDDS